MRHQIRWTLNKIENRLSIIENQVYRKRITLPAFRFRYLTSPNDPIQVQPEIDDSNWSIIQSHEYWVNPRTDFILRTKFIVPEKWLYRHSNNKRTQQIALFLPIGDAGDFSHPEALVYIDGEPYAGCDRHHQEIILPVPFCDGKEHILALHGWTGIGGATISDLTNRLKMNSCEIVLIDQPTRDFLSLARVCHGIVKQLGENDPSKSHLLTALDESFQLLDLRIQSGEAFYNNIPEALLSLRQGIQRAGSPLDVNISAIGHAHIDLAWLWTLDQTRQKAARTFYNVLRYMDLFPNYYFVQSQPQLYEYVQQDFPELFKMIKEKVNEGKWEPIGGMWVEADCNLTGSESLARQFLLGRTFYHEHFGPGVDSPVLWLPDVFGYTWNLPQLIKEAGLTYFFTIKIGWSQYNRLPYDSFWWQGLDGTKVLTHFSTTKDPESPFAATYNSDASPAEVIGTWRNFQQKDYASPGDALPILMAYGYGDGGGGPTREMLENIHEMANFPSIPKIKTEKVKDFFEKMEKYGENLPTWNGELYLEYHRGTYTTQARNKKANRKSEFMLHDAEFLATYAWLLENNYPYPTEQLTRAWKIICLNQFHDIIPGSSIGPVYTESLQQYNEANKIAEEVRESALNKITEIYGNKIFIINPTSFPINEILEIKEKKTYEILIDPYSIQVLPDIEIEAIEKPAPHRILSSMCVSTNHLENNLIRIELNDNGDLVRIYDKRENREVLPDNALANLFLAFEDIPLSWDAWDIDIFYDDKVWLAEPAKNIEIIENTSYRCAIKIERRILNSDYTQVISLNHDNPRINFRTEINWQERQTLLKVAFPVNVISPTATFEIQWGNVERPTHRNTSWDWARFETVAQKWVDLSEGGYGVSLLNDCKYGHDIHDHTIRLTLLRGTTAPDPTADLGEHSFNYSLLPHQGRWGYDTVREAYALNDPLIVFSQDKKKKAKDKIPNQEITALRCIPSLVSVDRENVIIETIKRAENGDGVIIRLYEYQRKRGPFKLITSFPVRKAWLTNILEENQEEITVDGRNINLFIKPYQILTLRLLNNSEIT